MAFPSHQRARLQATLAFAGTLFIWWKIRGISPALAAGLTGSLAVLAWLSPVHYGPVQRILDRILHTVLAALTWFILGVLYLLLFTPVRLWRGLTGKDPLQRRCEPDTNTYLRSLPPAVPGRFDRQF